MKTIEKSLLALVTMAFVCLSVQAQEVKPLKQFVNTQITSGELKRFEKKDVSFLKSLNVDRLLYCFRDRVGLSNPSGVSAYGGWEDPGCDLRGHSLGHYLTALSLYFAQSGDNEV